MSIAPHAFHPADNVVATQIPTPRSRLMLWQEATRIAVRLSHELNNGYPSLRLSRLSYALLEALVRLEIVAMKAPAKHTATARPAATQLTARELQIMYAMADGKTNAEIAAELYITVDTVKTHARRLYRKLGARDRANAVAIAFRSGQVR